MKLEGLLPTHDQPLARVSAIQGILDALKTPSTASPDGKTVQPPAKKSIMDLIDSVRKKDEQK
jgi:hypothetical protein